MSTCSSPTSLSDVCAPDRHQLLASATFASWREGATQEVGEWLKPKNGRTPGVIVSVAHLDDDERALVLGVLLEDCCSLGNAGVWSMGRLPTDADCTQVPESHVAAAGTHDTQ